MVIVTLAAIHIAFNVVKGTRETKLHCPLGKNKVNSCNPINLPLPSFLFLWCSNQCTIF